MKLAWRERRWSRERANTPHGSSMSRPVILFWYRRCANATPAANPMLASYDTSELTEMPQVFSSQRVQAETATP